LRPGKYAPLARQSRKSVGLFAVLLRSRVPPALAEAKLKLKEARINMQAFRSRIALIRQVLAENLAGNKPKKLNSRYFDPGYFLRPTDGRTWAQKRERQLALIEARNREIEQGRETIAISDNSPGSGGFGALRGD
jgi:hypothetical protein